MIKTYYANTGVEPFSFDPPAGLAFMDGYIDSGNGVYVIPFECEEVPSNYKYEFSCDILDYPNTKDYIIREITHCKALKSKYAYFKPI